MAPLFAVTIAVVAFGERPGPAVLVGALLVVAGGIALALEPERPQHVRSVGIVIALVGAALFALRDNLVRHLSLETAVPSMTAGAAMLAASLVVTSMFVVARRNRVVWPRTVVARWLLPGTFVGFSWSRRSSRPSRSSASCSRRCFCGARSGSGRGSSSVRRSSSPVAR